MPHSKETFERGTPASDGAATLPAATYNLTRILLAASPTGSVFVPIRPMQYMAVIDAEEIIFIDSQYKRWVELAWRAFRPQERSSLDEPVTYRVVYYTPEGAEIQRRLQAEFHKALVLLQERRPTAGSAHVLPFGKSPGER